VWAKRFGENGDQVGYGIAADSNGNIVITGSVEGKTNFGAGQFDVGPGNTDMFVARFGPDGAHKWSRRFGDSNNAQTSRAVAVDGAGNVLVTGFFKGILQLDGLTLTDKAANSVAPTDVFVAKLKASDGSAGWARSFGDTNTQLARAITVDPLGNVIFGGMFNGKIDFTPPATFAFTAMNNTYDAYWAKLAP
jgi:hypothetical protein